MGFYSTKSPETGAFVADKRTDTGLKMYDEASGEIGLQKQQALQNLRQSYASTIDNAYASYLASQRNINTSAMGEGYKQAYMAAQDQALQQQIAQTNLSVSQSAQEIATQSAEAQSKLQEAYNTEVTNIDKVGSSMSKYLEYVKSLRGRTKDGQPDDTIKAFTDYEETLGVDDLYERLTSLNPKDLYYGDEQGMSYTEWINSQIGEDANTTDANWRDWLLYGGGYQDFKDALTKRGKTERYSNYEYGTKLLNDINWDDMNEYIYSRIWNADDIKAEYTKALEKFNYDKTKADELYQSLTKLIGKTKKKAELTKDRDKHSSRSNVDIEAMMGKNTLLEKISKTSDPKQLKALKEYYNEMRNEYDALYGSGAYDKLDYEKWKNKLDDYNKQIEELEKELNPK